jgi:protein SCO1/2
VVWPSCTRQEPAAGGVISHMAPGPARVAGLVAAMALLGVLAGCGGSSSSSSTSARAGSSTGSLSAPSVASPPYRAPDFELTDSLGHAVRLSQFRGRAVLLTFIYDHCPDVCPLIVGNLHNALAQLGPRAARAQVVAVSVDPKGDTPKTVKAFLRAHDMTGRMEYLIGSKQRLIPVWKAWGVQVQASPDSREVGHSAFVYGISGSGKVTALYPSDFKPAWVAHDVPVLAAR